MTYDIGAWELQSAEEEESGGGFWLPDSRLAMAPALLEPGRKPTTPVEIDWEHWAARDLEMQLLLTGKSFPPRNLATGRQLTGGGTPSIVYSDARAAPSGIEVYRDSVAATHYLAHNYGNLNAGSFRVFGELIANGLGTIFSLRVTGSSTNTLCWRSSDSAINLRINGSTVTLTSSQQLYSAGINDIVIQWNAASNTRELWVNGVLEDSDATSFTWSDETNKKIGLFRDGSGAGYVYGWHRLVEIRSRMLAASEVTVLNQAPYQFLRPKLC